MSTLRKPVPVVQPGQRITATLWNTVAETVNERFVPRDLDAGRFANEAPILGFGSVIASETARVSETVRITNPEDENQYVDVDRAQQIAFSVSNGTVWVLNFTP